jgi:ankyrin repeat protein
MCNGHADIVQLLLGLVGERAINVHAENEDAFHWACERGHVEVIKQLLCHRSTGGAPAAATLRRGGEWGYVVRQLDAEKKEWCALGERPGWLAAVRRSGAMAARAVRRQRQRWRKRLRSEGAGGAAGHEAKMPRQE